MTLEPDPGRAVAVEHDHGRVGGVDQVLLVDIVEAVLRRLGQVGWTRRTDGNWCHVRPPARPHPVQGWKLHISATPLSAPLVLARSADIVIRSGSAFKFAPSLDKVAMLVSRRADRGAGGKFMTIYPDADEDRLRELAEQLHLATRGLPGPGVLSDRQFRPGSLVHYRYGAFAGVPMLGNDGMRQAMLVTPDGSLVPDQRRAWFSVPAWAPPDPFAPVSPSGAPTSGAPSVSPAPAPGRPGPVLLAGRYVVRQAIRHAFSGGVYRADDQRTGASVIIKQARPHTAADLTGADACELRRHEARMLRLLAPTGTVARLVEVFDQDGDLFLVQEHLDGLTLRDWVSRHQVHSSGARWGPDPAGAHAIARSLVDLMTVVHRRQLVLRDFNPNNVMVTEDGALRLIDLEMLAPAGQPAARQFTPGYEAPERRTLRVADPAADRYSLGAMLFHLGSGADPVLPADEPAVRPSQDRIHAWLSRMAVGNPVVRALNPLILALMNDDHTQRPDLSTVREALAGRLETTRCGDRPPAGARDAIRLTGAELAGAISDAIDHLLDTMDPDSTTRLWPTSDGAAASDPFAVQHGAAGVLAALVRAQRGQAEPRLRDGIALTADWIMRRSRGEPRTLPGLYFGHAGVA